MKRELMMTGCLWALLGAAEAQADVPRHLNVQGRLTDDAGLPVPDDTYGITFRIYDAEVEGNLLWSETDDVGTSNGMFSAELGRNEPIDLGFDIPCWISLHVENDEEMARIPLDVVPYAIRADDADALGGVALAGVVQEGEANSVTTGMIRDGAVTTPKLAEASVTTSKISNNAVTSAKLGNSSVITSKLGNGAVTTAKLADRAVTTAKLADFAVSSNKLGTGAVTSAKIENNAIISTKLADGAVTTAKLGNIEGYVLDRDYDGTLITLKNGHTQKTTLSVRADQNDGTAISGYADGHGTAVRGGTWSGRGVEGFCNNTGSSAGDAVYGYSKGGVGVHGRSDGDYAVHAESDTGTALMAQSQTGHGVYGFSNADVGVEGYSADHIGGYFKTDSTSAYALEARARNGYETNRGFKVTGTSEFRGDVTIGSQSGSNRDLDVWGRVFVRGVQQHDLAEPFDLTERKGVEPGSVLVIDLDRSGRLCLSAESYDRRVAGIVSGAGGLSPGFVMGARKDGSADLPVAVSGRVYAKVDATECEVEIGDLLTTSSTPGHAMAVRDFSRSQGAVIGKAMEPLPKGRKGLILVLVALQ